MADDEREEERRFLAGLKTRTGRDLGEWMAAIAASGFQDKNEIIDWLRTQGFPFARASWLERIHRNGGKPIHAEPAAGSDAAGLAPGDTRPAVSAPRLVVVASAPQKAGPAEPIVQVAPKPSRDSMGPAMGSDPQGLTPSKVPSKLASSDPRPSKPSKKAVKAPPRIEPGSAPALEKLVAAAKGYRPLYHHLEAQVRRAIPAAIVAAQERYVAIGAPLEFAAITLHPTEIRLGLALGNSPFDPPLQPAKLRGPGPTITHMLVLTDARQVNDELLALLRAANAEVNA